KISGALREGGFSGHSLAERCKLNTARTVDFHFDDFTVECLPSSDPPAFDQRPLADHQEPVYQQWCGCQQQAPTVQQSDHHSHQRLSRGSKHLLRGYPVCAGACGRCARRTPLQFLRFRCRPYPFGGDAEGPHTVALCCWGEPLSCAVPRLPHEVPCHVPCRCPHLDQVMQAHHPAQQWLLGAAHPLRVAALWQEYNADDGLANGTDPRHLREGDPFDDPTVSQPTSNSSTPRSELELRLLLLQEHSRWCFS
ncbi:dual specificity phosphatase 18, partial [Mus musculus]